MDNPATLNGRLAILGRELIRHRRTAAAAEADLAALERTGAAADLITSAKARAAKARQVVEHVMALITLARAQGDAGDAQRLRDDALWRDAMRRFFRKRLDR